jgi:DNA-3-methyladenine glycosylase I
VLKKRDGYRKAFAQFDYRAVANFNEHDLQQLLQNKEIIRNRLKIRSAVQNARAFLEIRASFGSFDQYIWTFTDGKPIVNRWKSLEAIPATSKESDALSKDLKKRGFNFVGSTIIYAHMQACGLVNDHTTDCFRHQEIIDLYS